MSHPYKAQAESSHKAKTGSMGKINNLDIPVMRAAGENSSKKIASSSSSQQHKSQSAADGMKRGGHVGKPKHSKPKIVMVAPAGDAAPPPMPDPAMAAAGAGSSPAPAPMPPAPGQPPMKRGGAVNKPVAISSIGRRGGGESGVGRLDKAKRAGGAKMVKGKLSPIMS